MKSALVLRIQVAPSRDARLLDERQAAGVVEQQRRIVGLRGEGSGHAQGLGALLENAEPGRVDRDRGQRGRQHQRAAVPRACRTKPPDLRIFLLLSIKKFFVCAALSTQACEMVKCLWMGPPRMR